MSVLDAIEPTPLQSFTASTLEGWRSAGKCESLYIELKAIWTPEDVTRCVCAFANASGGYLLFGVSETADGCVDRFPGLDPGPEYETLAKDRIVQSISPLPVWDAVRVDSPDHPSRPILVMKIEPSPVTPHVVTTSGRIYVRTPNACDPVRDRATIDVLVTRGTRGPDELEASWASLLATPWQHVPPTGGSWTMVIGALPFPPIGARHGGLLTSSGYSDGALPFATDSGRPRVTRMLEEGVLYEQGDAEIVLKTDGAVMYRLLEPEVMIPEHPRIVPLPGSRESSARSFLGSRTGCLRYVRLCYGLNLEERRAFESLNTATRDSGMPPAGLSQATGPTPLRLQRRRRLRKWLLTASDGACSGRLGK
jgi:hypothetical protein